MSRHHVACFFKGDSELLIRYEAVIAAVAARREPRVPGVERICGLTGRSTKGKKVIANSCPRDKARNFHVLMDAFMAMKVE